MEKKFTLRGFVIGSLLCILIGAGNINVCVLRGGSPMAHDFFAPWAIFVLFILTLINAPLRKINEKISLSNFDLIVIYIMSLIACAFPGRGDIVFLPASLVAPFYYATPENKWLEVILPNIKKWMVPQDPQAIKYFFEGLPVGAKIPWKPWIMPLFRWSLFLLVLHFVMICMMVIMRKQWVENEKLVFPLVYLPLELARQEEKSALPPILKNKLLWIGFAIPAFIGFMRGMHYYVPSVPTIKMEWVMVFFRGSIGYEFLIDFAVLGFIFLLPTKISFSLWFFIVLYILQQGIMNFFGYDIGTARMDVYSFSGGNPAINLQGIGALIFFIFSALWISRRHLKDVFSKAIGKRKELDDSNEILSYPVAFWGIIAGLVYIGTWLVLTGLSLPIAILFIFFAFVLFIGLTKLVAEAGIIISRFPVLPSTLITNFFDSSITGTQGVVGLTYSWVWAGDVRTFVMPPAIHGMKMTEGWKKPKPLFWAMILAAVVGSVSAIWAIIYMSYKYGGINMRDNWVYNSGQQYAFNFATYQILNPSGVFWKALMFMGIGAIVMAGITFMHYNFLWWPFYPLAFPAVSIVFVRQYIPAIFFAWLVKVFILRVGGIKVYRKSIPFFLGLILGQFTICGAWLFVDVFAGGIGNWVFHMR